MDVLLREKRDLESAKAFFEQAVKRRGVVPAEVVTDKHQAYFALYASTLQTLSTAAQGYTVSERSPPS